MKQITCLGTSHLETDIFVKGNYTIGGRHEELIYQNYGGTMRNVSHNLALMGFSNALCTKLGNDIDGINLWNELMSLGVDIVGPTINLPTPKKVQIFPTNQKSTIFWDKPEDFSFHKGELLPFALFDQSDYCITDIKDNDTLEECIKKSPHTKWILSHYIPNREVSSSLYGIVINYEDAISMGPPSEFERFCYRQCVLGAKWVVINMNFQGIYVYENKKSTHFATKCKGNGYPNGLYSAFLSGLVAGLSLNQSLNHSVEIGLIAQALTYKTPNLINPKINQLFRRKNME